MKASGSPAVAPLGAIDLRAWYAGNGRDLPWRRTRDPWAIVVAEMMLQQTQVDRVVPRWHRFLARFPTVEVCAAGQAAEVIEEWSGLGYNRRALSLHRLAVIVATRHDGEFPVDRVELEALPGIGPYTSRAIRVFAFEQADAVLDTNVARILARTAGRTLTRSEAQAMADASLGSSSWHHNQAMLDIGARFCRPKKAGCDVGCPLRPVCSWAAAGWPEPDPAAGSAGVSGRQSRFDGSDRQGRGRLVDAMRSAPVGASALASTMGWPDDPARADRVAATLVADGLAVIGPDGAFELPT